MITTETLETALELIAKGVTRPTRIAKALGVTYRTYCNYMVRSNGGDPQFIVTYNGTEMQWARAITLATKLALIELRGMVLQESIYGYLEEQTRDGQVVWALDPAACAASDDPDIREMLGYRRDGLLEIDGKLVPHVVRKKAPWAQQQRLLEAAFADLRPSQTITQNVNVSSQGVGVGFASKVDYSKGPPPITPPPPMPAIEPPITDAEFSEVADDSLDDILGPEPEPAVPVTVDIAVTVPEPERVIRDTPTERETVAPPTPRPMGMLDVPARQPRNDLERDLFARIEARRNKGPTE